MLVIDLIRFMIKKLSKRDKLILDNLDRILAGEPVNEASSFLEEKLLQVLRSFEYTEEKRLKEQESTSRLMSDISHQIKTPLSALLVHLDLVDDEALTSAERTSALMECKKQSNKISFLCEAMFKASRLETGLISVKPIEEDIVLTLSSAISVIKPAVLLKGLTLNEDFPQSLIISHDPIWTKEALVNILDNAIKYTETGSITIFMEKGAIYTRIDITDTGIGIAPDDYTKIFQRFYRARQTTSNQIEGTGLGLSIAREIMRQQSGNITVSSNYKGSTFSLFLQNR